MQALCKSGSLFEVTVPDYKQLKACRREVCLLKELWDMIVMVRQCSLGTRHQEGLWQPPQGPQDGSCPGETALTSFSVWDVVLPSICGRPLFSPPPVLPILSHISPPL